MHPTLESTSHTGVIAAGDCAVVLARPREKAGVFAVRQGLPLAANLRLRRAVRDHDKAAGDPRRPLLFDPETAGGLLAVATGWKRTAWPAHRSIPWR